ncbi:MAG TPA: YesL family protein [Firmicutes bacterium]|nr:YesL family protein [Bacillota bacterium]
MAGFFGMFDYSKPGAGVDKGGPQKKRFFLFFDIYFRKFWKLVLLNLLYIAFCIPIVTIGPATAGFTYVLRNYAREEHAFLFSDFIDAFRKNWKQSALLFVLNCACIFLIVNAFIFYWSMESTLFAIIAMGICFFLGIILLFMNYYAHLMIVTTALPFKHILKNSFFLSFIGVRTNLITTFFVVVLGGASAFFYPFSLPVIIFLLFSTVGLIVCFNSYPYIKKYVIDPYYREREEKNPLDMPDGTDAIFTDIGSQEVQEKPSGKKGKTIS